MVILGVGFGIVGVGASALTLGGSRISHVSAGVAAAVDVVLTGLEGIRLAPLGKYKKVRVFLGKWKIKVK